MSTTADRRRSNLQGGGDFPRFDHKRIEINTSLMFSNYDKEAKENVEFKGPITGVLIGTGYYQEAFNRNDNSFTKSGVYFTKKHITMFSKGKKVFGPDHQDRLEEYLKSVGCERSKKSNVIFVLTDDGNVLGVVTNLVIAIDQMQNKSIDLIGNKIILNTKEYDPADQTISKKGHEFLGKFATTNKPKYASISEGEPITEELEAKLNLGTILDDFEAFKAHLMKGGSEPEVMETTSEDSGADDLPF